MHSPTMNSSLETPKKRKRVNIFDSGYDSRSCESTPSQDDNAGKIEASPEHVLELANGNRAGSKLKPPYDTKRRKIGHVSISGPAYPLSAYQGWQPSLDPSRECDAVQSLQEAHTKLHAGAEERPDYTYFQLDDFNIYRPKTNKYGKSFLKAGELVCLDQLRNRKGGSEFLFEGVLSCGGERRYVHDVPFSTLTIEGYGDPDVVSLEGRICIQSPLGGTADLWYQLGTPSLEYRRFYTPFKWLAQFTKFFVDYLLETQRVTLLDFRERFAAWLRHRYSGDSEFQLWLSQVGFLDFRSTVTANVGYLWKELCGLDGPERETDRDNGNVGCGDGDGDGDGNGDDEIVPQEHPIWGEADPLRLTAIPKQPTLKQRTVVTRFAYDCFKHMYFTECLDQHTIENLDVLGLVTDRKKSLRLTPMNTLPTSGELATNKLRVKEAAIGTVDVQEGDVVCVEANLEGGWKSTASLWYAYVQSKHLNKEREEKLDVLWLYHSTDTTLGSAYYPFRNELFLSDNCGCGEKAIHTSAVLHKVEVEWFATDPAKVKSKSLFVRQKFRTVHIEDTYDFLALKRSDFRCRCQQQPLREYDRCRKDFRLQDTVLVLRQARLEPAQIVEFDNKKRQVIVRQLDRKASIDGSRSTAQPNELFLTNETIRVQPSQLIRKCHVQRFRPDDVLRGCIPTPYDHGGTGDLFYIADRRDSESQAHLPTSKRGNELPPPNHGWDPRVPSSRPKLRGMGIFCGGGNLDRGLEDGGAVDFVYAVDWLDTALHSYRANAKNYEAVHFWSGSVNDYLAGAINGSFSDPIIARPGDFDVLSAGSPCPGFSALQSNKQSPSSLMNASMVASVVSFVDLYSPKYCMLENVVSMTYGMGVNKDENVFGQILAALVALGYQVQQFLMDAWSFGSPQQRSRVFIIASAPGLQPLPPPQHTHAHPSDMLISRKCLGKSSNGKRFGVRHGKAITPFSHVSINDAAGDLPRVGDSQPQLCPAFPDHRLSAVPSNGSRTRIATVPVRPYGMGLLQAYRAGLVSGEPARYCERLDPNSVRNGKRSTSYARVYSNGLFPTVITQMQPHDGVAGRVSHWAEHRPLTVMEVRRAQGFLDHEVIVGTPPEQLVIVGNSVDRKVSLALGIALRESWEGSESSVTATEVQATSTAGCYDDAYNEIIIQKRTPDRGTWVEQSRAGTLRLSPIQIADVRVNGFKAIRRILAESSSRARDD